MYTFTKHSCQLVLKFADKSGNQDPEKWLKMSYRGNQMSEKKEVLPQRSEEGVKLCGGVEVKAKGSQVKNSFYKRFPILVFHFDSVI